MSSSNLKRLTVQLNLDSEEENLTYNFFTGLPQESRKILMISLAKGLAQKNIGELNLFVNSLKSVAPIDEKILINKDNSVSIKEKISSESEVSAPVESHNSNDESDTVSFKRRTSRKNKQQ